MTCCVWKTQCYEHAVFACQTSLSTSQEHLGLVYKEQHLPVSWSNFPTEDREILWRANSLKASVQMTSWRHMVGIYCSSMQCFIFSTTLIFLLFICLTLGAGLVHTAPANIVFIFYALMDSYTWSFLLCFVNRHLFVRTVLPDRRRAVSPGVRRTLRAPPSCRWGCPSPGRRRGQRTAQCSCRWTRSARPATCPPQPNIRMIDTHTNKTQQRRPRPKRPRLTAHAVGGMAFRDCTRSEAV